MTTLATPYRASESDAKHIPLGSTPLLFVDDAGIERKTGVWRTIHTAQTLPHPVLEPDRAWEGGRLYIYGSVYADPQSGQLTMWHQSCATLAQGSDLVLIATSSDGVVWEKPLLGVIEFEGSRQNNIVYDLHSPSVLFDRFETDPSRRYKMLGSQKAKTYRGYDAACSPDGVHWTGISGGPVLESSDTITLSQNCSTGEYLAFHKRPTNVRGFKRRVVWLSRSADFVKWSQPELVFVPDEEDDSWVSVAGERTEVYNMSVLAHAAGFLGLPTMFRVTSEMPKDRAAPGQSPLDGPIDVQLVTSVDGITWRRTWPRVNVIPRGEPGTFDGGVILGLSSTAVEIGDLTCVYYTAINTGHGGKIPPKRLSIGRAQWRRHGFASLDADCAGGVVETRPVHLQSGVLFVNADARLGQLRVELREIDGSPIDGFTFEQSSVLSSNDTRWRAVWQDGKPIPTDRPIRITIAFAAARLYSIHSSDLQ